MSDLTSVYTEIEQSKISADRIYEVCNKHKLTKAEKEKVFEEYYDEILPGSHLDSMFFELQNALLDSWPNINFASMSNKQREDMDNILGYLTVKQFDTEDLYILVKYKNRYYDLSDYMLLRLAN